MQQTTYPAYFFRDRRYKGSAVNMDNNESGNTKKAGALGNAAFQNMLQEIKAAVKSIAGKESQVILYGSYARGEAREDSDVDLMIVLPDDRADFQTETSIRDAVFEAGYEHDVIVSAIIVSESQKKKFSGFKVFDSVEKEGLPV